MTELLFDIRDIRFRYPHTENYVLDKVSLQLKKGEVLSILGPNGVGKSTLLNCMGGLLKPESGSIFLDGKNMSGMSFKESAKKISYVQQQHIPTFAYSVADFVLMGRAPQIGMLRRPKKEDENIAFEALRILGIEHLANKPYTDISGGERQQVTIARAIVQQPQAILFDEPTAHLDFGNQYKILQMIRRMSEQGYAVVMTTHNPDHAIMLGDKAAILDRGGEVYFGAAKDIITEQRLKKIYNIDLRLVELNELSRTACLSPGLD